MKSNQLIMLPLVAVLICIGPVAAQAETELDMTMTIIEEGQGPEGLVRRIQLPSPEEVAAQDRLPLEEDTSAEALADQVESESAELLGEAVETVNDTVKNTLSIDGAAELPGNIVDNLSDDLPLVDGITDEVDQELPLDEELPLNDELPLDNPLDGVDGMMLDSVNEAADVTDSIDDAIDDSVDEAADIVDETDVEGAAEDAAGDLLEQTNDAFN